MYVALQLANINLNECINISKRIGKNVEICLRKIQLFPNGRGKIRSQSLIIVGSW